MGIIEKLKDKNYVRAFGLMTPEEQECFKKAERYNCHVYYEREGWVDVPGVQGFSNSYTYAIKPDYQPEPEFANLEISERDGWLGIEKWGDDSMFLPFKHTHLHCLPSLPNFRGFWFNIDTGMRFNFTDDGQVATYRDEGKKVFARFRSGVRLQQSHRLDFRREGIERD